eukprot:scaffold1570_cov131-Isochrysis_galbana.AAC.4
MIPPPSAPHGLSSPPAAREHGGMAASPWEGKREAVEVSGMTESILLARAEPREAAVPPRYSPETIRGGGRGWPGIAS